MQTLLASAVIVILELFTSEGCSSCPPADQFLQRLVASQPVQDVEIVALGEHVDYWDRLGWKDRFSSALFTQRQQMYGTRFNLSSVYTPQMVVDGCAEFVGTDADAARKAIERARAQLHGTIHLKAEPGHNVVAIAVATSDLPPIGRADHADVVVAITEGGLRSDVKRGENAGRLLAHAAVVRHLAVIGEAAVSGSSTVRAEIPLGADWQRDQLKIVAFVQERRGRAILASASTAVPR